MKEEEVGHRDAPTLKKQKRYHIINCEMIVELHSYSFIYIKVLNVKRKKNTEEIMTNMKLKL